ncbi:zinc finger protein 510-like [Trichogramma pretiosum]|uniref:zinc finger protein 510-like n=1 Tax=Trichogramma pretiosum TaxID=7493 RepID=UPI0006C949A2|nr:zinc finger protein 510-like [Trichogramma pretiosum]
MESTDVHNCAVRVKKEHNYALLSENGCEMIDVKPELENFQPFPFPQENSVDALRKCVNRKSDLDNEMKIVFECEDVKPNIYLSLVKKIDDYFQYHMQNIKDSDCYKTQTAIKIETMGELVKKEIFGEVGEEPNLNFDGQIIDQNKKMITKKINNQNRSETLIVQNDTTFACEISEKILLTAGSLRGLVNSSHHCIRHLCDICGKTFAHKGHLKAHKHEVHSGITHACDICGKQFLAMRYLKTHIHRVHSGMINECDICEKKFQKKRYLQMHFDTVHFGITHVCNTCGKSFSQKSTLKNHIDIVHNGVIYVCEICGKKSSTKRNLKQHVDTEHNDIKHTCDQCEKSFPRKGHLKIHIDSVHNGLKHPCDKCEKSFSRKNSLTRHLHSHLHSNTQTCNAHGK